MTDNELIKRLAELLEFNCVEFEFDGSIELVTVGGFNMPQSLNPLVDTVEAKAFCFDLIVKYRLTIETEVLAKGKLHRYVVSAIKSCGGSVWGFDERSPQRAIIKAVVAKLESER